jgi:hypothetical protein
VQPFQTRPQQPVQQAIQQPVQQAIQQPVQQAIQQPVQQAIQQPVQQAIQQPVQQAPPETAAEPILPNLPELPAPEQQLQIQPPIEEARIISLSTPEPQAIALPPSPLARTLTPQTKEITLPDAPAPPLNETPQLIAAPISQELELPDLPAEPSNPDLILGDAPPVSPVSRDVTLDDAPPPSQTARQVSFELSDIEQNHWAESHEHVPSLVRKFEGLLVGNTSPNQWNTQHSKAEPDRESTSSHASYPSMATGKQPQRGLFDAEPGPASYPSRAAGKQPQRGPFYAEPDPADNAWDQPGAEPGPSSYPASRSQDPPTLNQRRSWSDTEDNDQSQFFRRTTHFTRHDGTKYPYTPYAPAQPRPAPSQPRPTPTQTLQAENAQLRREMEAERQLRREAETRLQQRARAAPPPQSETRLEGIQQSRHAPAQAQTGQYAPVEENPKDDEHPATYHENLLQQLVRHNMQFSTRVTDTTEEILRRTNNGGTLKDTDVGLFEPKGMPDSAAAMNFIDGFYDAAMHYGEARTLAVLRKCCKNDIARSWVAGLADVDRTAIRQSLWDWERVLRRDFMPRTAQLYAEARNETFKWTQNRTPAEYITHKMQLLRIAGVTDSDHIVEELHNGFMRCPEMHIPMEAHVQEENNDVAAYR